MMPTTRTARLDDVRRILLTPPVELGELGVVGHDSTVTRKSRAEDIGDENQIVLGADRAHRLGATTHGTSRSHQLRVGITHVFPTEPAASKLVDQRLACHAMVDDTGSERRDGSPRSRS